MRAVACAVAVLLGAGLMVKADGEKVPEDKVPKAVMDAAKARFPGAKFTSITKEKEDGKIVYDLELTHEGKKYEMDIHEDGTVVEIEKEVALKDLPEAVTKAVDTKFPKATIKEIMEVNKVDGKKETPDHYEITIETADKKKMEVIASLDGKTVKGEDAEKKEADKEEKVALDKLPKPVAEAVKKRFPKAEVKGASTEMEGGKTVYEVTLKEDGKNIDVSLTPEGSIITIEKELAFADLPKAVAEGFEAKHPKATYKIVEAVIKVTDGKETLEYYEAVVVTADKKTFEVEILPDGKFKGESEKKTKD
jgi:uncharacterized membrane protein YkoI